MSITGAVWNTSCNVTQFKYICIRGTITNRTRERLLIVSMYDY